MTNKPKRQPAPAREAGHSEEPRPKPSKRAAAAETKRKVKPPVRNGGAAGNARNPMQNAETVEPHAESTGGSNRKPRQPEATCGAKGKQGGGPCRHPAGFRTDHSGEGRCYLHGGRTPAPIGRYAAIKRPRVKELLEKFEADPDPMNLLPEAQLMRALLHDFIDRYDAQDEMLTRWNLSFERQFQSDWVEWYRNTQADVLEMQDDLTLEGEAAKMPDPMDYLPSKPLRMADITEVGGMITRVGNLVKQIRDMQSQHTFTMDTITLLWKVMSGHITDAALEVIADDDIRESYLAAVERRFATISLAELASRRVQD